MKPKIRNKDWRKTLRKSLALQPFVALWCQETPRLCPPTLPAAEEEATQSSQWAQAQGPQAQHSHLWTPGLQLSQPAQGSPAPNGHQAGLHSAQGGLSAARYWGNRWAQEKGTDTA